MTGDSRREIRVAMLRGARNRCPCCGARPLFQRFLATVERCHSCGTPLGQHRADDLPPYVTIVVVGHVVVPLILGAESVEPAWPLAVHLVLWPCVSALLCLLLMQPVKGAVVGLQWALRLHGFGPAETQAGDRSP